MGLRFAEPGVDHDEEGHSHKLSAQEEEEAVDKLLYGRQELQAADLSLTCRRERFCITCSHAFCPHCCCAHHSPYLHFVIRVDADADSGGRGRGRLVFATHYSDGERMYPRYIRDIISSEDYAARLPRDAFCLHCGTAFSAAACPDHHGRHHGRDLPEAVLRIVEHDGRHCVRCTGSEWWFPYVEMVLDDPAVHDDGEHQLLPVLTAKPGTCMQCGAPYLDAYGTAASLCSRGCEDGYDRELAGRRQRRHDRRAARGLPRQPTFD